MGEMLKSFVLLSINLTNFLILSAKNAKFLMSQNSYKIFLNKKVKKYLEKKTLIGSSTWDLSKPFGGLGIFNHDGRPLEMVSFVVHFPWFLDAPQRNHVRCGVHLIRFRDIITFVIFSLGQ
jgi:hypothetical protein